VQHSFLQHKTGLLKKAIELAELTGYEISITIKNPTATRQQEVFTYNSNSTQSTIGTKINQDDL